MEKYDVQYAPLAIEDLRNNYGYIAHSLLEPTTALKQVYRIFYGGRNIQAIVQSGN